MKPILSLFQAALLGAIALAAVPAVSQAAGAGGDGLRVELSAGLLLGGQDDDRDHRHRRDNGDQRAPERRDNRDNGYDRRDNGGYDRREEPRDDRINRAIAIGQSRGHVLNAWPQGGSLFMVRVDTPRGRVDMIIDVDSGRIVDER